MTPALPLWRRAAAILSLLVLGLAAIGLVVGAPPSQAYYDFNLKRLQQFRLEHEPRRPDTLRVFLLGNSRLKNGTIDGAEIEQWASRSGDERVEYFRLVANWAVFRNFAPLLDEIRGFRPDVYVVQMDLLLDDMAPAFKSQLAFNYLRWLTAGNGPWSWYEPRDEQLTLVCTNEKQSEMRAARAVLKLTNNADSESPRMARQFIRDIAADGARVILVSVPKSHEFESVSPSVREEMLSVARQLASEMPNVTVAPFAASLPDDHFCDVTHLNHRGAAAYSRWLGEQLRSAALAGLPNPSSPAAATRHVAAD